MRQHLRRAGTAPGRLPAIPPPDSAYRGGRLLIEGLRRAMRLGKPLFSLGCSCQTRFAIDILSSDTRRNPFDFNISTKRGILDALRSEGKSFQHDRADAEVYETPRGVEGLVANGIFFWHDYARDESGKKVQDGWDRACPEVAKKYRYLWPRFMERIRSAEPKTFVLSNTQSNLEDDFASSREDFEYKFGLDLPFFTDLLSAFDELGAKNFEVLFLLRNLTDCIKLRELNNDPRLSVRFGSSMPLSGPARLEHSLLLDGAGALQIDEILGRYDSGTEIRRSEADVAVVFQGERPLGEVALLPDAFLFMFSGVGHPLTAYRDRDALRFSNNTHWTKVG